MSVSAPTSNPFGVSGELGVGTASILGANATQTTGPAALLVSATPDPNDPFYAISQSLSADKSPTIAALETGKLTSSQHNVIAALAAKNGAALALPWNTNGTEPTTVAQIRGYGWIKLIKPTYDPTTRLVTGGTYELTAVGKAIAKRTGGSGVSSTGTNISA